MFKSVGSDFQLESFKDSKTKKTPQNHFKCELSDFQEYSVVPFDSKVADQKLQKKLSKYQSLKSRLK